MGNFSEWKSYCVYSLKTQQSVGHLNVYEFQELPTLKMFFLIVFCS